MYFHSRMLIQVILYKNCFRMCRFRFWMTPSIIEWQQNNLPRSADLMNHFLRWKRPDLNNASYILFVCQFEMNCWTRLKLPTKFYSSRRKLLQTPWITPGSSTAYQLLGNHHPFVKWVSTCYWKLTVLINFSVS